MSLVHLLPPHHAFLPLVDVDGRPRLGTVTGRLPTRDQTCPTEIGWMTEIFRKPTPLGAAQLMVLHHDREVLGIVISPAEETIPTGLARQVRITNGGEDIDHGAVVALVDPQGRVLSSVGSALGDSRVQQAIASAATDGKPRIEQGWWVEVQHLRGPARTDLLAHLRPARPLRMPEFSHLTPTQLEVSLLAARGLHVREIAELRSCRKETVRSHLRSVYDRLGLSTRAELVPVISEMERWVDSMLPDLEQRWPMAIASLIAANEVRHTV